MDQFQNEYVKFLMEFLSFGSASLRSGNKKLKVVFDCSNGSVGTILKYLNIGTFKVILINQNPDGNFPAHGPNPLKPGAMNQIQNEVKKQKADLGVIFDADGDRAFFIDDKGRFINPDIIARLLIWDENPDKVVVDVRTGWTVRKFSLFTFHLFTSRVGHYFIKKLMKEKNITLGCEQSGHYYFKLSPSTSSGDKNKYYYADSGILGAVKIINAVSKLPYKISDFVDLLPRYYRSGEINIMNNESRIMNNGLLLKKIEKYFLSHNSRFKILNSSHIDGLSMEFSDYWFNIRPSNTEPVIRVNVEAASSNVLAKQTKLLLGLLQSKK